jgi:hypothetical protein
MADEFTSPPYPKDNVNVAGLSLCLMELIDWVNAQIEWANVEAERLHAPEQPLIKHEILKPKLSILQANLSNLPIQHLYRTFQLVRIVREEYDNLFRNNEEITSWNSDVCTLQRIMLLRSTSEMLKFVCLDKEKQEAWFVNKMKTGLLRKYKQTRHMLRQVLEDDVEDNPDADDDDDDTEMDKLFNPN